MNRLSKTTAAVLTGAALFTAVPILLAQPGGPDGRPGGPGGPGRGKGAPAGVPAERIVEHMSKRLDLTPDQKTSITAILEATRKDMREEVEEARDAMKETREKIQGLLTAEQKEKAMKNVGALAKGAAGFMDAHGPEMRERAERGAEEIKMRVALGTLDLTAEQKEKLKAIHEETRDKVKAIQDEVKPKLDALRKETKEKAEAVLTPEQKEQLEKTLKEMPEPGKDGFRGLGRGARGMQGGPGMGGPNRGGRGQRGFDGPGKGGPDGPPPAAFNDNQRGPQFDGPRAQGGRRSQFAQGPDKDNFDGPRGRMAQRGPGRDDDQRPDFQRGPRDGFSQRGPGRDDDQRPDSQGGPRDRFSQRGPAGDDFDGPQGGPRGGQFARRGPGMNDDDGPGPQRGPQARFAQRGPDRDDFDGPPRPERQGNRFEMRGPGAPPMAPRPPMGPGADAGMDTDMNELDAPPPAMADAGEPRGLSREEAIVLELFQ
ncbi:MAG: hypothetical protein K1X53_16400 [Candidatus Sumerlaeaceae bacterium]|nr:hypothetical protein [Candidatus Sumerlaeaceae bacterium]